MEKKHSEFMKNWIHLLFFGIIGFVFIALYIYISNIYHLKNSTKNFDILVKDKLKSIVKAEVLNRIDEIDYDLNQIINEEKFISKQKVIHLKKLLFNSSIINIKDFDKRKKAALIKAETFIKTDPDSIYFIMSSNGTLLLSGTNDKRVNSNLFNSYDKDNISIGEKITKVTKKTKGAFVTYYWPKVKNGIPLKKTSFCLYIPEFDFIIGTGTYEKDIFNRLKKETFNRIQSYYETKENYIFIVEYDGLIRVHPNLGIIGKNVLLIEDKNFSTIHNTILNKLKNKNGFVSYSYYKRNSNILSEKITYVHDLDRWHAYIGMGFHIDDTSSEIEKYTNSLKREYINDILTIIILLLLIGFMFFLYIQNGLYIQKDILKQEDIVFEQLLQLTHVGIIILSKNGSILYKNDVITKIFKKESEMFFLMNFQKNFIFHEKDIYSFQNIDKREYFIKLKSQNMFFHEKDCQLFIIEDISELYIRENKLQKLAYYDPLTNLPNRRKFKNDFEDITLNILKEKYKKIVIAMIDLDKFKNVNDKYGHNVGDSVLISLGKFLKENLRKTEYIYRFGGEEFIIIFKQIELEKVKIILEDINIKLSRHMLKSFGFYQTFSAGAVSINITSPEVDIKFYLKKADQLLYQAKSKGRNKVEIILSNN